MTTIARYQNTFLPTQALSRNLLIIFISSIALAAASQISIPWQPVPFTLQSAFVVLLGLSLGAKRATAVVGLYFLEGALGLPVFAGWSAGLACFFSPSGGYLLGFLPAAFVAGWLMERGMAKNFTTTFLCALLSSSIIFLFGILYLHTFVGWQQAYLLGVAPFLLTEPVKLLVASLLAKRYWKKPEAEKRRPTLW